jgi:hypothetical protein
MPPSWRWWGGQLRHNFGKINAVNLQQAHRLPESGQTIGKVLLEGF